MSSDGIRAVKFLGVGNGVFVCYCIIMNICVVYSVFEMGFVK